MNARNKFYGRKGKRSMFGSSEERMFEKIYEVQEPRSDSLTSSETMNGKSSSDPERSGSFIFECCNENSIYDGRIYAQSRNLGLKVCTSNILYIPQILRYNLFQLRFHINFSNNQKLNSQSTR